MHTLLTKESSIFKHMKKEKSLQETFAPNGICFGCGVKNEKGLRIRSFSGENGEKIFAEWRAEEHHQAFPGMLSGGIVGTLLDCHSNWTAAHFLMKKSGKSEPDCTVTANYSVKLLCPTPSDATIKLIARVTESSEDRATVEAELIANDKVCATCKGLFVAVKEGHPAYHRW
jgi:acyl-coenzyme A thioesterase PaaI-like protein